ncbi:MAG: type II secretion system protein M [Pseudomonadota bacterium]
MNEWWSSLQPRERVFVGGLGVFLVLFFFWYLLIDPLFSKAADYKQRAETAEKQLAWMQQAVQQLPATAQRGGQSRGNPNQSLNVIVDRTRTRFSLATTNTQQVGANQLRVRLEDASFDNIVRWLGQLRRDEGITIATASVTQTDVRGTTNATLTLSRGEQ